MKFCFLFLLFLSFQVGAHRYHTSTLYLTEDEGVKAILRLDSSDLQAVLRKDLGKGFFLEKMEEIDFEDEELDRIEKAVHEYLGKNLKFARDKKLAKYAWLDFSLEGRFVELYLEVSAERLEGLKLTHTVFFKHNRNQINYIHIDETDRSFFTSNLKNKKSVVIEGIEESE